MRVAVMSPTYNERDNIDQFLAQVSKVLPDADVYIVDDESPDGTGARVREHAASNPQLRLIARTGPRGYAAASREGLTTISRADYDVVVTIDCDLSHDPAIIPHMLTQITQGADMVIGSRYVHGGGVENWSLFRRVLSRLGNWYTAVMLGLPVRDCTAGFRAYRTDLLRRTDIASTASSGYAFLTETLMHINKAGNVRIVEVPIVYVNRAFGESKMNKTIISESMRRVTLWGLQRLRRAGK